MTPAAKDPTGQQDGRARSKRDDGGTCISTSASRSTTPSDQKS